MEQNQNRNFYRHTFNSIFLLTWHSSVFQIIFWNSTTWWIAKCRLRNSLDAWYYIVICATFCASFSSKLKATNVFAKHILKLKARDQSDQAMKMLFCQVIIKNYMWSILCKFLIKGRGGAKAKDTRPFADFSSCPCCNEQDIYWCK